MNNKTTMPEPLRLRWNKYTGRYDISEDHRAAGDADLITTTQAEAYADARVREKLEEAVQICWEMQSKPEYGKDDKDHWLAIAEQRIRALIPDK